MSTITRELAYKIRRALRKHSFQHQGPITKVAAMRLVKEHVGKLPRGCTKKVEGLVLKLAPYFDNTLCLAVRRGLFITDKYTAEIAARGGETEIRTKNGQQLLTLRDEQDGLYLLHAEGWRYYSARAGTHLAYLAYLCGRDDNGRWAVRVPGTCNSVEDALKYLTPADVQKAIDAGRTVLRQGDVYVVETTAKYDGKGELPANHRWCAATRELQHLDSAARHATLSIPFTCRFVAQKALRMGRLNTGRMTGRGD